MFSNRGFETHRYGFEDLAKKYGKPKAVSNNGQFFIFAKKKTLKLHIMLLTIDKLVLLKEIDVERDIKLYLENQVMRD